MIYNENNINNYIPIREEKILTNEDYSRNYNTLDEFCKIFNTVENAMYWYKYNNIKWPTDNLDNPNDRLFSWPEDILKTKVGLCWDHAIFFYYFCKKNKIPARIYRFAIYAEPYLDSEYWCMGHMVCICETNSGYYVCNYGEKPESNLYGPFSSYEDCEKSYSKWYHNTIMKIMKETNSDNMIKNYSKVFYGYVDNKDLKLYDKYYGNHNITQLEFDKLAKSTWFRYDYKSIKRNMIDNILCQISCYAKIVKQKIFDIFN